MARWRRIAWSLGLGVVTTVLVAWFCANAPRTQDIFKPSEPSPWRAVRRVMEAPNTSPDQTPLLHAEREMFSGRTDWRLRTGVAKERLRDFVPTLDTPEDVAPRWMVDEVLAATDWRDDPNGSILFARESGWPMRALRDVDGGSASRGFFAWKRRGAIVLREDRWMPGTIGVDRAIVLPWHVNWLGFTVDTVLYTTAWWTLLLLPGLVRRWWRRRGGRCTTCGYVIKGLSRGTLCPECGSADTPISTSTA